VRDKSTGVLNDTDYFSIAPPFVAENEVIAIKYSNNKVVRFKPYNIQGNQISLALNKTFYNNSPRKNHYLILLNRLNPITRIPQGFIVHYGSEPDFMDGEMLEINVTQGKDYLYIENISSLQMNKIKLKQVRI
jgi:hypothetical protein